MQTSILNDPYEGELFTWWMYFFGGLSKTDKQALWQIKRPQLVAVNYTGSIVNTSYSDPMATNYRSLSKRASGSAAMSSGKCWRCPTSTSHL
jgi:hypothetical protein